MNNITNSANVRLLTLGLGLVASLGAMSPAYSSNEADIDRWIATKSCENCDLSYDYFGYYYLPDSYLPGANFYFSDLTRATLTGANLSRTNFTRAILYRTNIINADLTGANLFLADLTSAYIQGANFTGADLTGVNLRAAIGSARSTSTSLSAASVSPDSPNFTDAILEGVTAKNALLPDANFTGTSLKGAKFSGSDLQGGDFTGADLTDGIFNRVNFLGANLTDEQLASAKSLRGSTLPDGTVVAAVPEPSGVLALLSLGLLGSLKRKQSSQAPLSTQNR